jgi:hypothetical protein
MGGGVFLLIVAATGCGNGEGDTAPDEPACPSVEPLEGPLSEECGEVPPCGGDPTGAWVSTALCDDELPLGSTSSTGSLLCDDAPVRSTTLGVLAYDFRADGTLLHGVSVRWVATLDVPPTCVAAQGAADCAELEALLDQVWACTADGEGGCGCATDQPLGYGFEAEGTWETCGPRLITAFGEPATFTSTGPYGYATTSPYGSAQPAVYGDYCVDGDLLRISIHREDLTRVGPLDMVLRRE